eukprot:CAMPEP_0113611466 /NCGR_PEP_ID=MMETSP0017_2-20120614/5572_1 /TAXON_ID=2856 /ORGANISM="Cylindrotheca closterium" /LENGTH=621 /DNA_ID=CAMNT_0000520417 /DNA_START=26 /DNA_END=1888 /DNA_ORIENTATION=- /assembly_acc=CAM_ASM_000147
MTPIRHHQSSLMKNPLIRRRLVQSFSTASSASTLANEVADGETTSDAVSRKILSGLAVVVAAVGATTFYGNNTTVCEQAANDDDDDTNDETATTATRKVPKTTMEYLNFEVWTPAIVAREDLTELVDEHDDEMEGYPVYTSKQVAENDGTDGKPIWMSYGGVVYDVTNFISNHPGGTEKIMMAAGSSIEPFWHTYRQHFASDLPIRLMEHMVIGRLVEKDQVLVDAQMEAIYETSDDPFDHEPVRHKALRVHSEHSMNAETPAHLLTNHYLTPNSLFYIRHHHPVPFLTTEQVQNFALEIDLSSFAPGEEELFGKEKQKYIKKYTLEDLKTKFPQTHVVATLQCSGNRRADFNQFQRTSGTGWGQGAISNAKWTGVRLSDLLKDAGLDDPMQAEKEHGVRHVRMHALDDMSASVGIEKVMNPYGDCIIAYEMNDQLLPRDHGYPLRVIIPGYAGIRNVKWVNRIELSKEEAEGPWQRGLNYKILPPSITDANEVDIEAMPSVMEPSLFSGITNLRLEDESEGSTAGEYQPGDKVTMTVSGWAWAGGGRNIVRVDVTGDNGLTWTSAELKEGKGQRFGKAWAWTFWEAQVPAVVLKDGTVDLASKAIDNAFNVQPESSDHVW